ncbi:MAG: hypothetical protein KBG28_17490 [Kofleriaceae bacterium]|jgi:hypothetical protein|nr:hypothetical protein [Kofleriaceae bacterium]MBP6839125.1 hypothetical protein [Kofleriaceae bacterium]MBP9205771.1 hypothetical protein [Kofleriaceae bacterium]
MWTRVVLMSTLAVGAACGDDAPPTDEPDAGAGGRFVLAAAMTWSVTEPLTLVTNLPSRQVACQALTSTGAPCGDADGDGLVDAWEDLVLDRFRPAQILDEAESAVGEVGAVLGNVGRVAPVARSSATTDVVVFIMLGYSRDYGVCGATEHDGDSERVALHLVTPTGGGPGDVELTAAYTAGHEGEANDQSVLFAGADLGRLEFATDPARGEPRWQVFPSQNKHATYGSISLCESVSVVPCFDEDCGPDGVTDPSPFQRLPDLVNAGEPTQPRVDDLSVIGFPGESAWAERDFCGGRPGPSCSSPVRDKLVRDPFGLL